MMRANNFICDCGIIRGHDDQCHVCGLTYKMAMRNLKKWEVEKRDAKRAQRESPIAKQLQAMRDAGTI